jgi:hypothetical protein
MEGTRGPLRQYNIPLLAYESRPRARVMCVLSEKQGMWELLRTAKENAWTMGIEPKTSALVWTFVGKNNYT